MKLFLLYLKQRRKILLSFALFCLIFAVTFLLYRLPIDAVLYPALLCALAGLFILSADFRRVYKKHLSLERLSHSPALLLSELPESSTTQEADYQEIIRRLRSELRELETSENRRFSDTVDYYTVWAHQIKTPIASMHLTLQNEDSALSRKLSADLFRIEQYVEMALAFLRLDSTSADYVIKEQNLDAIIRRSIRRFAGEFIGRKLSLHYEPANQTVITDEKWLCFVLEQLLSNALKYTPHGGVRIYLTDAKTLCIEDTGVGIAPEDLPRVFEKGYTGYNGRTDQKATGLGLYLCKSICTKLGHAITISSVPEQGTVVKLDLAQYKLTGE